METKQKHAVVHGLSLPISLKTSIEICNLLRHKETKKAKLILERVIKKQQAVPFNVFRKSSSHRAGKMAEGRYPVKASKEFLQMVKSAEANAMHMGMPSSLVITEIKANKGPLQFHAGRQRRIRHKRTHVTIKVAEHIPAKAVSKESNKNRQQVRAKND